MSSCHRHPAKARGRPMSLYGCSTAGGGRFPQRRRGSGPCTCTGTNIYSTSQEYRSAHERVPSSRQPACDKMSHRRTGVSEASLSKPRQPRRRAGSSNLQVADRRERRQPRRGFSNFNFSFPIREKHQVDKLPPAEKPDFTPLSPATCQPAAKLPPSCKVVAPAPCDNLSHRQGACRPI